VNAIQITGTGGPEVLKFVEVPTPWKLVLKP
jgi:hypothetical protein